MQASASWDLRHNEAFNSNFVRHSFRTSFGGGNTKRMHHGGVI